MKKETIGDLMDRIYDLVPEDKKDVATRLVVALVSEVSRVTTEKTIEATMARLKELSKGKE